MFRRDISPYSFFLSKEKRQSGDNKHERHSKMRNIRRSVPSQGLAKKESRQAGNDIADQIGFQTPKSACAAQRGSQCFQQGIC